MKDAFSLMYEFKGGKIVVKKDLDKSILYENIHFKGNNNNLLDIDNRPTGRVFEFS